MINLYSTTQCFNHFKCMICQVEIYSRQGTIFHAKTKIHKKNRKRIPRGGLLWYIFTFWCSLLWPHRLTYPTPTRKGALGSFPFPPVNNWCLGCPNARLGWCGSLCTHASDGATKCIQAGILGLPYHLTTQPHHYKPIYKTSVISSSSLMRSILCVWLFFVCSKNTLHFCRTLILYCRRRFATMLSTVTDDIGIATPRIADRGNFSPRSLSCWLWAS